MRTNKELAREIIENGCLSLGIMDGRIIITNGTIDYDSGICTKYNVEKDITEGAKVFYAEDIDKRFHFGMLLRHENKNIQYITEEYLERLLNDKYLNADELNSFFDSLIIGSEYCEWKRNLKFPEQINNPHNVPGTELISCTNFCPCCGKRIKIID